MSVLLPDLGGDTLVLSEHPGGQKQHILEVDDVLVVLQLLIGGIEAGEARMVKPCKLIPARCRRRVVLGGDGRDLRPLDLRGEVPQGGPVRGEPQAFGRLGDQPDLVVQQLRHLASHRNGPEVLELPQGGCMEGARLNPGRAQTVSRDLISAAARGGERHGQHAVRIVDARTDPIGDAVRDRPRLARPRPGKDAQGPRKSGCGRALLVVESVQDCFG